MVAPSHLKAFQALELALRLGSLKAAADKLGITPAAVGQRVKSLEDYLGVDLLVRGRQGLRATPELQPALERLAGAFAEIETVAAMLNLQRGLEIHIAAASDLADLWLKPRVARFREAHPNTLFCINGEGDAPLRIGPVDCEIAFGPLRGDFDLLFRDFVAPIASPENKARISALKMRDRLEGFPLLHVDLYKDDPEVDDWAAWASRRKLRRTAPERGMRFQRITPALEAVLADAGIALCGIALLTELLADGRLSLPFPASAGKPTAHAYQARFRRDVAGRPQIRRFREFIAAEGAATRAQLAGIAPQMALEALT